jgi:serine/threonine-protein kinase
VRKLALSVNLGPEPSISEALTSVKSKAKANSKAKPKPAKPAWGSMRLPKWAVPAGGAGAVLLMAVVLLALQSLGGGTVPSGTVKTRGSEASKPANTQPAPDSKGRASEKKLPEPRGKEVRVVDGDGTAANEPDLASALRRAVGSKGYVLLVNRNPLTFSAEEAIKISGGRAEIRAREGIQPVLVVEIRGGKPFLTTLADSALRIEGVSLVARYTDASPGTPPTPVIEAGGDLVLERCALSVEGTAVGSAGLLFQGKSLSATGCWFENFDQAVVVDAFGGSTSRLRHCMFIRTRMESPGGWAVRVRRTGGGFAKTVRKLELEHCTTKGEGFLAFSQFTEQSPLAVDLKACAVMTEALLSWEAETPEKTPVPPTRKALSWRGQENQLDVRGKSWVLAGPNGGPTVPLADGPSDLESWTKQLGAEVDPVHPPVRFATDPSALPEHPGPDDFATGEKGANAPGADASRVGPLGSPTTKP